MTTRVLEAMSEDESVDAVGFSMGAITLVQVMIEHPNRFHCVVLAGIGDGLFQRQPAEHRARIAAGIRGEAPDDDKYARQFGHYARQGDNDVDALSAIFMRPEREPLKPEQLGAFTGRVLVVIGDRDEAFPADQLAASFRNGKLKVLKLSLIHI